MSEHVFIPKDNDEITKLANELADEMLGVDQSSDTMFEDGMAIADDAADSLKEDLDRKADRNDPDIQAVIRSLEAADRNRRGLFNPVSTSRR